MNSAIVRGICVSAVLAAAPCVVEAVPILTIGAGTAVTSPDLQANFDTLTEFGIDLNTYSEGGLNVRSVGPYNYGLSFPCDYCSGTSSASWYVNGGGMYDGYLSISTASGERIRATEFAYGSGWQFPVYFYWETWSNSVLTGSGTSFDPGRGTILGFNDDEGFDELRMGAFQSDPGGSFVNSAGGFRPNAIAIDNLSVQTHSNSVPEPATIALLLGSLPFLGIAKRRRRPAAS
jgi:hypothetical protein